MASYLKKPLFKILIEMETEDGISYLDNIIYRLKIEKHLTFKEIGDLIELGESAVKIRFQRIERRKM